MLTNLGSRIGHRKPAGSVYTGMPHETIGYAWLNLEADHDKKDMDLQNLAVNCAQYPGHPYCDGWRNAQEAGLQNLDTELDYYHSDGKTSFTGNRKTRTHIKDVSMGPSSTTSFGLLNLVEDLSDDEDKNSVDMDVPSDDEESDDAELQALCHFFRHRKPAAPQPPAVDHNKVMLDKMGATLKKFEAVAAKLDKHHQVSDAAKKGAAEAKKAWVLVAPQSDVSPKLKDTMKKLAGHKDL